MRARSCASTPSAKRESRIAPRPDQIRTEVTNVTSNNFGRCDRALARPLWPHGLNSDSCFRCVKTSVRRLASESASRNVGLDPTGGGKNFREKHSYCGNTARKSAISQNRLRVSVPSRRGKVPFASGELWLALVPSEPEGWKWSKAFIRATILRSEDFRLRTSLRTVLFLTLTLRMPMLAMHCILRGPDGPANQP